MRWSDERFRVPRIPEHQNWIGGVWRGPVSGIHFEMRDAAGRAPIGRFPRSTAEDLDLALRAASPACDAWRAMTETERRRRVARLQHAIDAEPDRHSWMERRFGLTPEEYASCEGAERARSTDYRGLDTAPPRASDADSGVVFLAADWSELLDRPLARLCAALASGCPVVVRADPELAGAWDWAAHAIERADLPPGSVSVLHEDTHTCTSAALRHPLVARVAISGAAARLRWAAEAARADTPGAALDTVLLCNRTHSVASGADLAAEARLVADGAFGRAPALSGQAPGQIGRVLCPERSFSRFTAALLAILDSDVDVENPVPIVDAATKLHLARAYQLGIDEGATLILARRGNGSDPARALVGEPDALSTVSRVARADGILRPVVFTNVEEHMRIAWLGRPAPVLCLMRVESDEQARALASELDGDIGAEDLSA